MQSMVAGESCASTQQTLGREGARGSGGSGDGITHWNSAAPMKPAGVGARYLEVPWSELSSVTDMVVA